MALLMMAMIVMSTPPPTPPLAMLPRMELMSSPPDPVPTPSALRIAPPIPPPSMPAIELPAAPRLLSFINAPAALPPSAPLMRLMMILTMFMGYLLRRNKIESGVAYHIDAP